MDYLLIAAIVMIAFRVNEHYWLVALLGGYVITAFAPIAVVGSAIAYRMIGRGNRPRLDSVRAAWLPMALYIAAASLSLLLHEPTLDTMFQSLSYVWAPVAVFACVLWLPTLQSDDGMRRYVSALIVAGSVFALYAMYSFAGFDVGSAPLVLQTNQGEWTYFSTYEAGFRDTDTIRRTVPGLNTSHFAPMLLPLVFLGMLRARRPRSLTRVAYLAASGICSITIAEGLSRGAMIPLIVGVVYLAWVRWYGRFGTVMAGVALVVLLITQPLMYARIIMTIGSALPIQDQIGGAASESALLAPFMDAPYLREDHFLTNPYTVNMMLENPLLGLGWTPFTDAQAATLEEFGGKDHNNYLSVGAAFGLPALMFYVSFIVGLGIGLRKVIRRSTRGSEEWRTAHCWFAVLIGYTLYFVGAPAEFQFVWLWFGLIAAWVRNQLVRGTERLPQIATASVRDRRWQMGRWHFDHARKL